MITKRDRVTKTVGASHRGASVTLAVTALIASSAVLPSQADGQGAQDGKALFEKRCTGCHALDTDHEGPRLRGVVERAAGTVKTFVYSQGLKNAKYTWDEATLDKWLTDTEWTWPHF